MRDLATKCLLFNTATLALLCIISVARADSQIEAQPWVSVLGDEQALARVESISTEASVSVSDGLTYDVALRYRDPQIAIFHREYVDRRITLGVDGKYVWSFDGTTETEAPVGLKNIINGHQLQAQLLFFDRMNSGETSLEMVKFKGCDCMAYSRTEGEKTSRTMIYDRKSLMPVAMKIYPEDRDSVLFEYSDWREVDGVQLPFAVDIDDGQRQFAYRFHDIRIGARDFEALRAPYEVLSDEQKLLRLHRRVMEAHLDEDITIVDGNWGVDMVMVGRGEVDLLPGSEAAEGLGASLARRDHSRYDDLIRPIVRISDDGMLGWVVVQVEAEGIRLDEASHSFDPPRPLYFVAAWIALYEKVDGDWRMVGNVSNFRPE